MKNGKVGNACLIAFNYDETQLFNRILFSLLGITACVCMF